ncbi:unnamed protein product [Gordionus sp. m RMFG-2023]|uniref:uncharacterized protein LOC135931666 n=1 Tax=Gordionus sp. m RMFG-2023 TaxID=3053472 RepID=UPI0030E3DFE9
MDKWELLTEILQKQYLCSDCGQDKNLDYWLVINKGVLVCDQCALIHASLGRHVSVIKCLTYPPPIQSLSNIQNVSNKNGQDCQHYHISKDVIEDRFYWSIQELKLLKYFLEHTGAINSLWEGKKQENHFKTLPNLLSQNQDVLSIHSDCDNPYTNPNFYYPDSDHETITLDQGEIICDNQDRIFEYHDKAVQINIGSCASLANGFITNEITNTTDSCYSADNINSDNVQEIDLNSPFKIFKVNPLFMAPHNKTNELTHKIGGYTISNTSKRAYQIPKPTPSDPIMPIKSDYIRSKYQLMTYFDDQLKPDTLTLNGNPKEVFDFLNASLLKTVSTACLEDTIALLVLGADPNTIYEFNEEKRNFTCPLIEAIKANQQLQCYILIFYGAHSDPIFDHDFNNNEINGILVDKLKAEIIKEINFHLTDTLYQYRALPSFSSIPQNISPSHDTNNFKDVMNHDEHTKDAFCINVKLFLSVLNDSIFYKLMQDVYEEIRRRETDYIFSLNYTCNDDTEINITHNATCLPINPQLSTQRNQGRQKLARLTEWKLKVLTQNILEELVKRQPAIYNERYESLKYYKNLIKSDKIYEPSDKNSENRDTECKKDGLKILEHVNDKKPSLANDNSPDDSVDLPCNLKSDWENIHNLSSQMYALEKIVKDSNSSSHNTDQLLLPTVRELKSLKMAFEDYRKQTDANLKNLYNIIVHLINNLSDTSKYNLELDRDHSFSNARDKEILISNPILNNDMLMANCQGHSIDESNVPVTMHKKTLAKFVSDMSRRLKSIVLIIDKELPIETSCEYNYETIESFLDRLNNDANEISATLQTVTIEHYHSFLEELNLLSKNREDLDSLNNSPSQSVKLGLSLAERFSILWKNLMIATINLKTNIIEFSNYMNKSINQNEQSDSKIISTGQGGPAENPKSLTQNIGMDSDSEKQPKRDEVLDRSQILESIYELAQIFKELHFHFLS